jgi:hypothetical protein
VWRLDRGLLTASASGKLELAAGGCWRDGAERVALEASADEAFGARRVLLAGDAERAASRKLLLTSDRRSGVTGDGRSARLLTGC